jgi:NDP-sugar pyrophosphorylase family protein
MSVILICPSEKASVSRLSESLPLSLVPIVGQGLLEYWLSELAEAGEHSVLVLAHHRPELIKRVVGTGARWGLEAEVIAEPRELNPAQALLKYNSRDDVGSSTNIIVLDHLPGAPDQPLFTRYADFCVGVRRWLPKSRTPDRVGVREIRPGIFADSRCFISPEAVLRAPCWVGHNVYIGAEAVIGPGAIVESGCFIEPLAEVVSSYVGPDTFVGRFGQLSNSLAWGSTLVDLESSSVTEVPDPFLMCALRSHAQTRPGNWRERMTELISRNKAEIVIACKHLLMRKES